MKYSHIKAAHISHADISKAFGFKNVKSFRTSSAHKRYMNGIETILELIIKNQTIPELMKSMIAGVDYSTEEDYRTINGRGEKDKLFSEMSDNEKENLIGKKSRC